MGRLSAPVLIIEDDENIRLGFQAALEHEGYAVETAKNGRDALAQLYRGLRPCIILMDLMMPVMNGFEFRQAQLHDRDLAGIPLIAYSAVTSPWRVADQLKANAYVEKPVALERVLALVNEHCRDPKIPRGM